MNVFGLKPCPFCGEEKFIELDSHKEGTMIFYRVVCGHCGAHGSEQGACLIHYTEEEMDEEKQKAIDVWNEARRPGRRAAILRRWNTLIYDIKGLIWGF
jgi:Lar family restriction alleviation protein